MCHRLVDWESLTSCSAFVRARGTLPRVIEGLVWPWGLAALLLYGTSGSSVVSGLYSKAPPGAGSAGESAPPFGLAAYPRLAQADTVRNRAEHWVEPPDPPMTLSLLRPTPDGRAKGRQRGLLGLYGQAYRGARNPGYCRYALQCGLVRPEALTGSPTAPSCAGRRLLESRFWACRDFAVWIFQAPSRGETPQSLNREHRSVPA